MSLVVQSCHQILSNTFYVKKSACFLSVGLILTFDYLLVLMLCIPVNNFSVILGQSSVFLGGTSTKQWIKCLAQRHNIVTPPAITRLAAIQFPV